MAELIPQSYEVIPIDSVTLWPQNPNEGDVGAIGESIEANDFYGACIVQKSTGHILVGNHRWLAAKSRGMTEIPVFVVDVDNERAMRIALADNRASALSTMNDSALAELLQSLAETETGLLGTLFDGDDLDELLASLNEPLSFAGDPDAVPEPPEMPVSKLGDVWTVGDHRICCGDARDPDDYARLLHGGSPDLLLTDPPYGVAIGAKNAMLNSFGRGNPHEGALASDTGIAEVELLWRAAFPAMRDAIEPGCPFYVFGPQGGDLGLLLLLLRESKIAARHILIWVKDRPTFSLGRLDYEYAHEPIAYGWKDGAAHPWFNEGSASSVIEIPRPSESKLHPTMKPVALLKVLIGNSTKSGGMILDPFGGSGSTLIAAHELRRRAYLLEIDPHYTDVILKRAQIFTGEKPILESTGEPYDFSEQS